jgi:hypothetical protein
MKHRTRSAIKSACACVLLLVATHAWSADREADDAWHLTGELYLWGASIGGTTTLGGDIDVGFDDLFDNLDFAFLGGLEVRKGR